MAVSRLRAVWNWFVFFVLYVALTWPVIQAMIKETGYFQKSLRSTLALSDRVFLKQFLASVKETRSSGTDGDAPAVYYWLLTVWTAYATVNVLATKIIPRGSIKYKGRSEASHRSDILLLTFVFGVLLWPYHVKRFVVIDPDSTLTIDFVRIVLYMFVVFSLLFEVSEQITHLTLTADLLNNLPGMFIVGLSLSLVLWVLNHHFFNLCPALLGELESKEYQFCILLSVCFHVILFFTPSDHLRVHVHHFYWPIPFALLCIFPNSEASLCICALFVAISLHGFAFFGIGPFWYPVVRNDEDRVKRE